MWLAILRCGLLFKCLLVALASSPAVPTSPIRHWDESWAASCVQGTAIARIYGDCAILFLRAPATKIWREQAKATREEDLLGLSVYLVESSRVDFAPPWISLPNTLCAMTGFSSDVEHLCRILQRQVNNHFNVYDSLMPVHSMTERVGELLHETAAASGGRPFGVQAMLLGGDDIDEAKKFCLYTIDPSGSWQSWPWGTAIGKFAKEIRSELVKKQATPPGSLKEVLEQIIECWIATCREQNVNIKSKEDFQVLVLRRRPESKHCDIYKVKSADVEAMVRTTVDVL